MDDLRACVFAEESVYGLIGTAEFDRSAPYASLSPTSAELARIAPVAANESHYASPTQIVDGGAYESIRFAESQSDIE